MADIKNQNTLYRFVSLRAPELSKKEDQEKRFVFHLDNTTGVFFDAVKNKPSTQTKWEALLDASSTFAGFKTVDDLENSNPTFFAIADWLMANKSQTADVILKKVQETTHLDKTSEINLWDNLFYQVITQKDFYIKEGLIQMLVLQNLLKQVERTDDENTQLEIIPIVVAARVVLPFILFNDENEVIASISNKREEKKDLIVNKEILDAQQIVVSKLNIENQNTLIGELQKLSIKYQKEKEKAYSSAFNEYKKSIKPTIDTYQKEYNRLKRLMCSNARDENYDPNDICNLPDIEYPELPEFRFDYQIETDPKYLEENLTEDSFNILTDIVDITEIETFNEAISAVQDASKNEHQTIFSKTNFTNKVLTFGDVSLPVNQNTSKSANFPIQICSSRISNGNVTVYMTIQFPDSSYDVNNFYYSLVYTNGVNNTNGAYVSTKNGNTLTLSKMFNDTLPFSLNPTIASITGYFMFTNGQEFIFEINPFNLEGCYQGVLVAKNDSEQPQPTTSNTDTFIPQGFGYRQLGIADYKKVVSEVCCYDAGEVAHIENVMAREIREKTTTKTHTSEVTTTDTTEVETEKLTDTTSTERFEMQSEIAKMMQEQQQMNAHADIVSKWPHNTLDAGASYASNTSKEESNRQAVTQAKEVTQRAMERIVSRVKNEKTVKITDQFIEENKHGFDNTQSDENVSGVYRFINAIYKNQIYNYGKRLMYEFMIPQPSELHRLGMKVSSSDVNAVILDKPIDPRTIGYTDFNTITQSNYQALASKYSADVATYPIQEIYAASTFDNFSPSVDTGVTKTGSVKVPDGYYSISANANITGMIAGGTGGWDRRILVSVGDINFESVPIRQDNSTYRSIKKYTDSIPVAISITNFHTVNITVNVLCNYLPEQNEKWKKETFDAIIKGYEAQLEAYNQQLAQSKADGVQMLDSNPLFYREIEEMVLRKNCISYLIDDTNTASTRRFGRMMYNNNATFLNHQVTVSQDMDNYGSFAKFMEQAFEWNLMSYNFYPFYWGNRDDWSSLYQFETNDPVFRSFMQAGMARVIVTVKPGFEDAIMHYMKFGQIWNGGQMPIIGDPLYLSIVDELKEQEYVVEDTWETVLPTNLIALQSSGVAVDASGLPCGEGCEDHAGGNLVENKNKLGVTKPIE